MDDIERIEGQRYGVFSLTAVLAFMVLFLWKNNFVLALTYALALALLTSGAYVAKKLTSDHAWALLEAEGRVNGSMPSRREIWLGNLLPGLCVLALAVWWNLRSA